jgi:hypothetical protein
VNNTITILIGVFSGVLATITTASVGIIWREILQPKLNAMRYTGLVLSGKWHADPPQIKQEIFLDLDQVADKITGIATLISEDKTNANHEFCRTFRITGFIKDGIVLLNSLSEKQNRLGIHTFLLKASGDGRELLGIFTYHSVIGSSKNTIVPCSITLLHESCNSTIPS